MSLVKGSLLGDTNTGKTTILNMLFMQLYKRTTSTIGVQDFQYEIMANGKTINMMIQDTGGQEKFKAITRQHIRNRQFFILVYDITERKSFDSIPEWFSMATEASVDARFILVGNKTDLDNQRQVQLNEGQQLANSIGAVHCEMSALTNYNCDELKQILFQVCGECNPAAIQHPVSVKNKEQKEGCCA